MARQPDRLTAIVEYVSAHDVPVEWEGGWETRGGRRFAPQAATFHHDASPKGSDIRHIIRDGHSTLSGPLANFYPTRAGSLVVIAAGRANHAGKGGWKGLRGNSTTWGIEIANNGVGEPYGDAQLRVVTLLMRAFVVVDGVPVGFLHSHHEWAPDRKRDPALDPERQSGPWNMDRFRHDVSRQPDPEPDPEDDDMKMELWTGPDPQADDDSDHKWLIQRDMAAPGDHLGYYTKLTPAEAKHYGNLADDPDRGDVIKAEAKAARSWFTDARLARK